MDHEIELISDGDGLAVIGDEADVEQFLVSEGLPSRDLGLRRLTPAAGTGAVVARAGSEIAGAGDERGYSGVRIAATRRIRGEDRAQYHDR